MGRRSGKDGNQSVTGFADTHPQQTTQRGSRAAWMDSTKMEEKYRTIFENSMIGFYQVAPEGGFIRANMAAARILGYDSPEDLVRSVSDITTQVYAYPEDRARALDILKEHGCLKDFEVQCRHKDGSLVWVLFNAYLVRDKKGNLLYHEGSSQDIRRMKDAEIKLAESEATARALLDAPSEDTMCLVDRDALTIDVNKTLARRLGKSREELLGTCMLDLYPEHVARARKMKFEGALKSGKPVRFEDERQGIWSDVTIYPVLDEKGNVLRVAIISHDITDRKHMEEELRRHRDHLEEEVTARTDELKNANAELEARSFGLEELNTALKVLLRQREGDKKDLEQRFTSNVKTLILPYIEKIKKGHLDAQQRSLVDILEANLNEVVTPFLQSIQHYGLTPRELLIASLIKDGKTTKEIAEIMGVATSSIDSHRNSIRRKLKLKNQKVNLQSYLETVG
jgi:PAS domain S-box-containing protein